MKGHEILNRMEQEEAMLDGKIKEEEKPQREFRGFAEGRSR